MDLNIERCDCSPETWCIKTLYIVEFPLSFCLGKEEGGGVIVLGLVFIFRSMCFKCDC